MLTCEEGIHGRAGQKHEVQPLTVNHVPACCHVLKDTDRRYPGRTDSPY